MRLLVLFAILALSVPAQTNADLDAHLPEERFRPKIVGGNVATLHQFPHQVALLIDGWNICGGSIIASKTIVTAAHCLRTAKYAVVIAGGQNIVADGSADSEKDRQVVFASATDFILHPTWNPANPEVNDIALIILQEPLQFSTSDPIAVDRIDLYSAACNDESMVGTDATVSGWGRSSDSTSSAFSDTLRYAESKIITNADCNSNYGNIQEAHVCLDGSSGVGTCYGDSGGPLIYYVEPSHKAYLVGVVSFGSNWGCEGGYPSVYTRVSCFEAWIREHTVPPSTQEPRVGEAGPSSVSQVHLVEKL